MKKIIKILLVLFIILLAVKGCFKVDNAFDEEITSEKVCECSDDNTIAKRPAFKTVFYNGVDYIETAANVGKFGGSLRTSIIGEGPKTFNIWNAKDATSAMLGGLMFDGLVSTDIYTGEVIPRLAKDIKISNDNKTYTVKLRRGLKWSDGKPLTADDVVFTWNKIILAGMGDTSTRDSILIDGKYPTVEKIDDLTVKFTTPKPFAPFLRILSAPIAPKHVMENVVNKGSKYFDSFYNTNTPPKDFVVSGPFKLKEYVCAQRVIFEKNPYFYIMDKNKNVLPYLTSYQVIIVGDFNNEILKFEAKELDTIGVRGINVARFGELEKKSDYKIYNTGADSGTLFLAFNLNDRKDKNGKFYVPEKKQRWFQDKNFRTAVDYAIDRESMVNNVLSGVGAPLFTAEALPSLYINKELKDGHKRDLSYAKELLKKSGFYLDNQGRLKDKYNNFVEFDLFTNAGNTERESVGVIIKEDLKELGIKVNFKPIEFNSLINKTMNTLDWDTVIIGLTGNILEPHFGKNVWNSQGPLHLFNQRTGEDKAQNLLPWEKKLDEIYNKASLLLDFEQRAKLYNEYQAIVYEEKPLIYLYSPLKIYVIRKKFGNVYPTALGGLLHNIEEVYIK